MNLLMRIFLFLSSTYFVKSELCLSWSIAPKFSQAVSDILHELLCRSISTTLHWLALTDAHGEVLGHLTVLNCLDNCPLKSGAKAGQVWVFIKLSSVSKTSRPGEDGSNWVCGCLLSLLVGSVVSSHCAMGSFSLNRAIW